MKKVIHQTAILPTKRKEKSNQKRKEKSYNNNNDLFLTCQLFPGRDRKPTAKGSKNHSFPFSLITSCCNSISIPIILSIVTLFSEAAWLMKSLAFQISSTSSTCISKGEYEELSDGARKSVKYFNVMGVPLAFIVFGITRWRLREQKRSKISL